MAAAATLIDVPLDSQLNIQHDSYQVQSNDEQNINDFYRSKQARWAQKARVQNRKYRVVSPQELQSFNRTNYLSHKHNKRPSVDTTNYYNAYSELMEDYGARSIRSDDKWIVNENDEVVDPNATLLDGHFVSPDLPPEMRLALSPSPSPRSSPVQEQKLQSANSAPIFQDSSPASAAVITTTTSINNNNNNNNNTTTTTSPPYPLDTTDSTKEQPLVAMPSQVQTRQTDVSPFSAKGLYNRFKKHPQAPSQPAPASIKEQPLLFPQHSSPSLRPPSSRQSSRPKTSRASSHYTLTPPFGAPSLSPQTPTLRAASVSTPRSVHASNSTVSAKSGSAGGGSSFQLPITGTPLTSAPPSDSDSKSWYAYNPEDMPPAIDYEPSEYSAPSSPAISHAPVPAVAAYAEPPSNYNDTDFQRTMVMPAGQQPTPSLVDTVRAVQVGYASSPIPPAVRNLARSLPVLCTVDRIADVAPVLEAAVVAVEIGLLIWLSYWVGVGIRSFAGSSE